MNRIAWGFKTASFSFLLFFQITADIIPRFVLFVKRFIKKIRFFCVFVFLIFQLSGFA